VVEVEVVAILVGEIILAELVAAVAAGITMQVRMVAAVDKVLVEARH
jgi:hypothetical protein